MRFSELTVAVSQVLLEGVAPVPIEFVFQGKTRRTAYDPYSAAITDCYRAFRRADSKGHGTLTPVTTPAGIVPFRRAGSFLRLGVTISEGKVVPLHGDRSVHLTASQLAPALTPLGVTTVIFVLTPTSDERANAFFDFLEEMKLKSSATVDWVFTVKAQEVE